MNTATAIPIEFLSGVPRSGPLTWGQLAIWDVLTWLPADDTTLTLSGVQPVPPGTGLDAVAGALAALIIRHESLRTVFSPSADGPVQHVVAQGRIDVPVHDTAPGAGRSTAESLQGELRAVPYDMAADLPLRAAAVTEDGQPVAVVLTVNHMAVDAWSFSIMQEDLAALLAASPLPGPGPQPLDRLAYEQSPLGLQREQRALRYWSEQIGAAPTAMLSGFPEPSAAELRWGRIESSALAEAVRLLAVRTGTAPSLVTLALTARLLARYTGSDRSLLRLIVATRFNPKTRRLVGAFNQNAVFGLEIGDDPTDAFLRRASLTALESYQNCEYDPRSLEVLIDGITAERGIDSVGCCFFNDVSFRAGQAPAADAEPESAAERARRLDRLRAETTLSVPDMDQVPKGATFFLFLDRLDDLAILQLCADRRFLAPRTPTDFLHDLEGMALGMLDVA
ncbi:hypothetical protein ABIA32_002897 [Streptacidiphilus sp. MAP12-20]|uniref:condensation domain-containing protein n=1 Tax=Streptacidiphilus sp. MAP12-20 TaxID=3156299 RepID=UPI0035150EFF